MAKKKRSKKRRKRRREAVVQARPVAQPEKKAASKAASAAARQKVQVDFRKEYPYVYSDLQRVAIIAATMLILLVALSFVLK